jgi:hypothetical protein
MATEARSSLPFGPRLEPGLSATVALRFASLAQVTNPAPWPKLSPIQRVASKLGRLLSFRPSRRSKEGSRTMTKRYLISVEPIEPSGLIPTIAELPRLVIFGQTAEDALGWAREAIAFQSLDSRDDDQRPQLELVLGRAS